MQVGVSRIPEGGDIRLPDCGANIFPQGGVIFSPWRGLFFSRKMVAVIWCYILTLGTQVQCLSPKLPIQDSLHATPDHTALSLPKPKVCGGNMKLLC